MTLTNNRGAPSQTAVCTTATSTPQSWLGGVTLHLIHYLLARYGTEPT
jgi:hypothetical protein